MTRHRPAWALVTLVVLVSLFAARLVHTAWEKSFTYDEPHYVGTGLYLWRTNDYQWMKVLSAQPPLAFHLAGLPWLARGAASIPVSSSAGFELLRLPEAELRRLRLASRLPFIVLACWGAVLVFLWARAVAGPVAGILAAFLYTFSPTILANAPLAHSDITVSVLYLQTLYAFWRWCDRPSAARVLVCGLSLGLALLAKLSAILLLPTLALLLAVRALAPGVAEGGETGPPVSRVARARAAAGVFLALCAIAVVVLWTGYGGSFATRPAPGEPFADLPLPGYVRALLFDVEANAGGRRTFLWGRFSEHGWWYFFPLAFAVKTSVPVLALLALACLPVAAATRLRHAARVLGVGAAVYAVVACFVLKVPLGLRYILPLYPLLFVFLGARLAPRDARWHRGLTVALCTGLVLISLRTHPHYLAYFNELVGGPTEGRRYLLESSVDWGQDLTTLARYLRERGNPPIHLAYFGRENPATYGIRATALDGCEPVAGLVAISVNFLEGFYSPRLFEPVEPGCYDWLRRRDPVARPGHSIFVYDVAG